MPFILGALFASMIASSTPSPSDKEESKADPTCFKTKLNPSSLQVFFTDEFALAQICLLYWLTNLSKFSIKP